MHVPGAPDNIARTSRKRSGQRRQRLMPLGALRCANARPSELQRTGDNSERFSAQTVAHAYCDSHQRGSRDIRTPRLSARPAPLTSELQTDDASPPFAAAAWCAPDMGVN